MHYYEKKLYTLGGNNFSSYHNSLEILDLKSNELTKGSSMQYPRSRFSSILKQNFIYVMGGYTDYQENPNKTMERYDIGKNQWE